MIVSLTSPSRAAHLASIVLAVLALILIPAIVRAQLHFDRNDPVRTSIRFNWNGDAPRTRAHSQVEQASHVTIVVKALFNEPSVTVLWVGLHEDDPVPTPIFVEPADTLRGPPTTLAVS